MGNKIKMGMVGGGAGAFIGEIHRMAAALDSKIELVCGAFSRDPKVSLDSGLSFGLDAARCYASYQQMFDVESSLPEDQRMDFVAIVTPNHLHFPVAKLAIESGFNVLSDKPATFNLAEALKLQELLENSDCLYGLTHTYTGYPMVKEARQRILQGQLGKIRKVIVEYSQGWLANPEDEGSKQAAWRLDPKYAGISCCMGDIGVHAANLAEYVCDDEIKQICADIAGTVNERVLDDDGTVMLRFDSGARGVLLSSQIAIGEENNLQLRVYGDKASIEWSQEEPNTLWLKFPDQPAQKLRSGVGPLSPLTMANLRAPAGHPEGYIEAFANLYVNFAQQIQAKKVNQSSTDLAEEVPGIYQAIRGMAFIENVVAASQSSQKWHSYSLQPLTQSPDSQKK